MSTSRTGETKWPDTDVETLRELVGQRLSGTQIALIMGRTRNAILGKAWRLGISLNDAAPRRPKKVKPPPKAKPVPDPSPEPLAIPMVRVRRRRKADSPRYYNVAEIVLTNATCKWPVSGEGAGTRFCGHAVQGEDGPPYCPFHRGLSGNGHGTGRRHTPETLAAMRRAHARRKRLNREAA